MEEVPAERRDGGVCSVKPPSRASDSTKRPKEKKETRTPRAQERSGGTPNGEYAGGGKWCLAVMFRMASVWL